MGGKVGDNESRKRNRILGEFQGIQGLEGDLGENMG